MGRKKNAADAPGQQDTAALRAVAGELEQAMMGAPSSRLVDVCRATLIQDADFYMQHFAPYAAAEGRPLREYVIGALSEAAADIPFQPGIADSERNHMLALIAVIAEKDGASMAAGNLQRAQYDGVQRVLSPLAMDEAVNVADCRRASAGGRANAEAQKERLASRDQGICGAYDDLIGAGRAARCIPAILASRFSLSARQIKRILENRT